MEVASTKLFQSLSASGIAVLITFSLSVKEHEEQEGKPIKLQTILRGRGGFHMPRSEHNEAVICVSGNQS